MKLILLILIVFSTQFLFGQANTTLDYKRMMQRCQQLKLPQLQTTKQPWHIRVWTHKQVIDLWKDSKGQSFGKVTSWVQKYNKNNERNIAKDNYNPRKSYPNQFFVKHAPLTTAQTQQMMAAIASSQVNTIPDHCEIKNWNQGYDGTTYIIETIDDKGYQFKSYWSPKIQAQVKEAVIIQNFLEEYITISKAKNVWNEFSPKIPFPCYTNSTGTHICVEKRGIN